SPYPTSLFDLLGPTQQQAMDPLSQLQALMANAQQGGAALDPRMLRHLISRLDREIVQSLLGQQGAGAMGPIGQGGPATPFDLLPPAQPGMTPFDLLPQAQPQFPQFPGMQFPDLSSILGANNCMPQSLPDLFPNACGCQPPPPP